MTADTPTPAAPGAMAEEREIVCESCGGDGGGEEVTGHDPSGPVTRWHTCGACDGKGRVLTLVEPITMEDLDDGR